jgi:CRP-like cAMP-binding protein
MQDSPSLRISFLHFAQAFMVQTAHTAVANARGKLEERLARWLLMAHDRVDGDELPLTHEFLALMLGTRRPGVTVAFRLLEQKGLVSTKRALIVIDDRAGLIELAAEFYGVPEAESLRLTGWRTRQ